MNLSKLAEKAYEFLREKYIKEGYCFSGSISVNGLMEGLSIDDFKTINQVLNELQKEGLIQKSQTQAFSIELTKRERKDLIEKQDLASLWLKDSVGRAMNPIGEDGEITKVLKEQTDEKDSG